MKKTLAGFVLLALVVGLIAIAISTPTTAATQAVVVHQTPAVIDHHGGGLTGQDVQGVTTASGLPADTAIIDEATTIATAYPTAKNESAIAMKHEEKVETAITAKAGPAHQSGITSHTADTTLMEQLDTGTIAPDTVVGTAENTTGHDANLTRASPTTGTTVAEHTGTTSTTATHIDGR